MTYKIFIDGQEGTTGIEINKRLETYRNPDYNIEILKIPKDKRKDEATRAEFLNTADIAFLCLPDDAARQAVSLITNEKTRVIDASTAHRCADGWAYGIPELSPAYEAAIRRAKRVAVPGCFATGFVMMMRPLVSGGIIPPDYPVTCHSVTGYSGRGSRWAAEFEAGGAGALESPCFYALALNHKHLPEMQKHSGLLNPPIFTPIIANYYRGMVVACPLFPRLLSKKINAEAIAAFFADYYNNQKYVKVFPPNTGADNETGFLNALACNHTNNIEILVFGGDERVIVAARLDNLGKGASGAAVQNMDIMLKYPVLQSL